MTSPSHYASSTHAKMLGASVEAQWMTIPPHHISDGLIPSRTMLIQFLVNAGRQCKMVQLFEPSPPRWGYTDGIPGSWVRPGPAPNLVVNLGVDQQMGAFSP